MPLVVSELAPAELSEPEVARERVALAGVARREVQSGDLLDFRNYWNLSPDCALIVPVVR